MSDVLLAGLEARPARQAVEALSRADLRVEWVRTWPELKARAKHPLGERPLVVFIDLDLSGGCDDDVLAFAQAVFGGASFVAVSGVLVGAKVARLQSLGIPSLAKPVCPLTLTELALRLFAVGRRDGRPVAKARASFRSWFEQYVSRRSLSSQQTLILRYYLDGKNDKEIAVLCSCCEATVYEHWRRMAKKVGASYKADVIADFHRFLAGVADSE